MWAGLRGSPWLSPFQLSLLPSLHLIGTHPCHQLLRACRLNLLLLSCQTSLGSLLAGEGPCAEQKLQKIAPMPWQGVYGRRRDQFFLSAHPPSLLWPQPLLASELSKWLFLHGDSRGKPVGLGKGSCLVFYLLWDLTAPLPSRKHRDYMYEKSRGSGVLSCRSKSSLCFSQQGLGGQRQDHPVGRSALGRRALSLSLHRQGGFLRGVASEAEFPFFPQIKGSLGLQRLTAPGETHLHGFCGSSTFLSVKLE